MFVLIRTWFGYGWCRIFDIIKVDLEGEGGGTWYVVGNRGDRVRWVVN